MSSACYTGKHAGRLVFIEHTHLVGALSKPLKDCPDDGDQSCIDGYFGQGPDGNLCQREPFRKCNGAINNTLLQALHREIAPVDYPAAGGQ